MKGLIARIATGICGAPFLWGWLKADLPDDVKLGDAKETLRVEYMRHRVLSKEQEDFLGELASGCKDTAVHFQNRKRYILNHIDYKESPWFAAYTLIAPYCTKETAYPEQEMHLARSMINKDLEKGSSCLPYQKALAEALVERLPEMPKDIARAAASVIFFTCKEFHHKKSV